MVGEYRCGRMVEYMKASGGRGPNRVMADSCYLQGMFIKGNSKQAGDMVGGSWRVRMVLYMKGIG